MTSRPAMETRLMAAPASWAGEEAGLIKMAECTD
jgi:hypothetical protein